MSKEIENIRKLMEEKNVEFRDFRVLNSEIRKKDDTDEDEMIVEGIACVFNSETILYAGKRYTMKEIIDSNAFSNCNMTDVIFNYNHGGRVYARTRNKKLELWIANDGLHMRATLMKNDEGHAQLYRDIISGNIDKMSFAFHVAESKWEYFEAADGHLTEVRTVLAIDRLYDVSAVDFPAYDATSISARTVFDAERQKRSLEREEQERKRMQLNLKLKLGGI